jgi:ubiquinone/menaquinone biosynthesis C-methylase UbiE
MYSERAANYEDSWHPDYSRRFIAMIPLQLGQRVLSLCCGTGLDAFLAAEAVGETGLVVGVDITPSMLAEAQKKLKSNSQLNGRLKFLCHDVTSLDTLEARVQKGWFDVIMCSNAFVLLQDSLEVVRKWKEFLRPGGILVIDMPAETSMRSGIFLETVVKSLGMQFHSNRTWIKSIDSFSHILEDTGLVVETAAVVEKVRGEGSIFYTVDQADEMLDNISKIGIVAAVLKSESKDKVRDMFREEWEKAAVNGKVEFTDSMYVYIARRSD